VSDLYYKTVKTKIVSIVSTDPALRGRIIEASRDLFLRFGYSRVTTDEISRELGISKATLYRHFSAKRDVLEAIVDRTMEDILSGVDSIMGDGTLGFLEKLAGLLGFIGAQISRVGGVFAQDLRRSAPDLWDRIERFRREKIFVNFRTLMADGVRRGVFRKDINRELLLQIYMTLVQEFVNPDRPSGLKCTLSEIFETIARVLFEGVLTDRGRRDYVRAKAGRHGRDKERHP